MKSPLPTYSIYGEHGRTIDVDWLHCESIAERSRLQDWEIGAHKHELLIQLFWIERGACVVRMDGQALAVRAPCVLVVPPLVVHGFQFEPRLQGHVVTVLAQHVARMLAEEPALERLLSRAQCRQLDTELAAAVANAMAGLMAEFHSAEDWRSFAVDSALAGLLVTLGRCMPAIEAPESPLGARALQHVRGYRALVEQRYRQQPTVVALASALSITPTQLTRVCRTVLGCSAVAVLHARLILEAQRELAYTTMSVKQIAHGLGFADAAYFTRFFQGKTGLSPTQWRSACGKSLAR